ncbi:phosphatase PAP2 family protein [Modestobacter sp. VKM Ac-2985]|uniref:phosphatase PAP2 family protein n=1 Tax=Modestobacter sp. VKM Ac-2985 TaxID=3004139 RepID=UPI0022AB5020|nr:phosphatase PAP2 family protein [Modestobacter sp. VKM Ac-2985]MCZ2840040.1 phosphatase PAP2 family protein [Modestobacter sp. VKM Ac-2985]
MTRGAVDRPAATGGRPSAPVIGVGRPPWWLLVLAALVTVGVTVNLLSRGWLERMDLRVSEVTSVWALRDSWAYWPIWVVTQIGGRVTILVVLAGLVGWLAVRQRTLVPLVRVVVALVLLTTVVYAFKWGTGRTAPAFPGSFFYLDGASYPSGHVANAVLMWGVARWQAVEFGLPPAVQRATWVLSALGPVATGVAMVALDFHWVTDAVVGLSVGLLLLGVVHALDAAGLSRWVRARAGRTQA